MALRTILAVMAVLMGCWTAGAGQAVSSSADIHGIGFASSSERSAVTDAGLTRIADRKRTVCRCKGYPEVKRCADDEKVCWEE
jgi:hypothetical protein